VISQKAAGMAKMLRATYCHRAANVVLVSITPRSTARAAIRWPVRTRLAFGIDLSKNAYPMVMAKESAHMIVGSCGEKVEDIDILAGEGATQRGEETSKLTQNPQVQFPLASTTGTAESFPATRSEEEEKEV